MRGQDLDDYVSEHGKERCLDCEIQIPAGFFVNTSENARYAGFSVSNIGLAQSLLRVTSISYL